MMKNPNHTNGRQKQLGVFASLGFLDSHAAAAAALVGGVVDEVALHSHDYFFWKKVDER